MKLYTNPPPGIAWAGGCSFAYIGRRDRERGLLLGTAHPATGILPCDRRTGGCHVCDAFSTDPNRTMDCKSFRKQHLAYLDDTMPGDEMASALHHVMVCDGCAAHDTLVRRSLMVARSMPMLQPSADFQARLRARLAECRDECQDERHAMAARTGLLTTPRSAASRETRSRNTRVVMAVAASAMLGAFVWQGWTGATAPELSMQPVIASRPAVPTPVPYITPELMQAMATGNPVWPAAMIVEDAPTRFVNSGFSLATFSELR